MIIKRFGYVIFTLFCMCVTPLITHAECDYQRKAELSRIASNVQLNYTYDMSNGVIYTLYMTNLTDDIYVIDEYGNQFVGTGEKSLIYSSVDVSGFRSGDQTAFKFYSNDNNCKGELITTKYVNFLKHNSYSNLEECKQNPSFKYCQVWLDTSHINYEKFKNELNQYLSTSEIIDIEPDEGVLDEFLRILNQPYIRITGIILIVITLLCIFAFIFKKIKYRGR